MAGPSRRTRAAGWCRASAYGLGVVDAFTARPDDGMKPTERGSSGGECDAISPRSADAASLLRATPRRGSAVREDAKGTAAGLHLAGGVECGPAGPMAVAPAAQERGCLHGGGLLEPQGRRSGPGHSRGPRRSVQPTGVQVPPGRLLGARRRPLVARVRASTLASRRQLRGVPRRPPAAALRARPDR